MVSAIYIIVIGLGAAFLLGLLRESWRAFAYGITLAALALMSLISLGWLWAIGVNGFGTVDIMTAGTRPPFAINLRVGLAESALLVLVNITGLVSAIHMREVLERVGRRAMAVLLIAVMALGGVIMTRDIFNLFVFFELVAISTAGLVLLSDDKRALGAGIKYLIIAQVISTLMLIGIIFTYHATGSLNIDFMSTSETALLGGGALAFFLLMIPLLIELKPFPANGWALDIYESAQPSFSALFSAATGSAALFAVDKVMSIGGPSWGPVLTGIGLLTFVSSNIVALVQTNDRRLLGYSSVAQTGLILVVIGQRELLGESYLFIGGGLLFGHAVAKAGLFWLSDIIKGRRLVDWADLRNNPLLVFAFATFAAMLVGLPPFPGFYAKWELVHALAGVGRTTIVTLILLGAMLEAGYLFRWFGYAMKREISSKPAAMPVRKVAVVTGSTSGIGRASAVLFAEEGARVVVHGRRKELGEQVSEEI